VDRDSPATYELWDLKRPSISKRSILYHLKPMAIGTGSVECLTSYVARLAEAHSLSPGVLLSRLLASHMTKGYWSRGGARAGTNGSALGNSSSEHAKAINGVGVIARDWVTVLRKLTQRGDLEHLTMLPWSNVFSQRNLLRSNLVWCPSCYESQRLSGLSAYTPLIWMFNCVTLCTRHKRRLNSRCDCCGKRQHWLERRSVAGHCSKCGEWLGNKENTGDVVIVESNISPTELDWQTYVTEQLEHLIHAAFNLPPASKQRVALSLSHCITRATDGNISRFAQLVGKTKNTVWGWQSGKSKVPIDDLLRICHSVGTSLVDFVYADDLFLNKLERVQPLVPASGVKNVRRSAITIDLKEIEGALRAAFENQPPRPMKTIAANLGVHKRVLYKHFSERCKEISSRHRQYRLQIKHVHQTVSARRMEETRIRLQTLGVYPSRRRVAAEMRAAVHPV
jgi:hypothetical protein